MASGETASPYPYLRAAINERDAARAHLDELKEQLREESAPLRERITVARMLLKAKQQAHDEAARDAADGQLRMDEVQ